MRESTSSMTATPSREGVHAGEHELWFGGVGHKACQVTDFEGM